MRFLNLKQRHTPEPLPALEDKFLKAASSLDGEIQVRGDHRLPFLVTLQNPQMFLTDGSAISGVADENVWFFKF